MKLLIYEHYDHGIHGNQRYLMLLLERTKCLYSEDFEIILVTRTEGVFYRAAIDYGQVVALRKTTLLARGITLWGLIRSERPDVVMCNNEASFLSVLPAAWLLSKKRVWHVKNLRRSTWSDSLCFMFASRVLAISPQSIKVKHPWLIRRFSEKTFLQPIGTKLDEFLELPMPTGEGGRLRVLALIFLHPDKGADVLVEALEQLEARRVHVHVCVAGITPAGWERVAADLKARTTAFENVSVEWLGWRDDVLALLEWAQLLVHPSRTDGVPRSIVEAMAAGRPVVASRVGGVPATVTDAKEGFLIPIGDAAGLADRIERLARDPELRSRMGASARIRARNEFDIDQHVGRLKMHLDAVVSGASG